MEYLLSFIRWIYRKGFRLCVVVEINFDLI